MEPLLIILCLEKIEWQTKILVGSLQNTLSGFFGRLIERWTEVQEGCAGRYKTSRVAKGPDLKDKKESCGVYLLDFLMSCSQGSPIQLVKFQICKTEWKTHCLRAQILFCSLHFTISQDTYSRSHHCFPLRQAWPSRLHIDLRVQYSDLYDKIAIRKA